MFNPNSAKISIDTETTGLNVWNPLIAPFAVSMCDDDGETWYSQWKIDPFTRIVTPDEDDLKFIQAIAGNPNIEKKLFNLKFDARMLGKFGIKFVPPYDEVSFKARVFNTLELPCKLKPLSWKYCQVPMEDEVELQESVKAARREGRKRKWTCGEEVFYDYWMPNAIDPENNLCELYARQDAFRTIILDMFYDRRFDEDPLLLPIYEREMKLWEELWLLEQRGLYWNPENNNIEKIHCFIRLEQAEEILFEIADKFGFKKFNPNSDKQVGEIVFNSPPHGLGMPCEEWTKTGQPKTDHKTLVKFADQPFIRALFAWKTADKGMGFFEQYEKFACPDDPRLSRGRILHPNLKQLDSRTCRFSCEKPNLQQIPDPSVSHKSGDPIEGRLPFGPRPGHVWICVDYSGQEVRIFGDIANIEVIKEDARLNRNFHKENANRAWGGSVNDKSLSAASYALGLSVPGAEGKLREIWDENNWNDEKARRFGPTSDEAFEVAEKVLTKFNFDIVEMEASYKRTTIRNRAKQVMFAKIYGGGANAVQQFLFCSYAEAKQFMNDIDSIYPGMKQFNRNLIAEAREYGFIVNPFGRKIMIERDYAYKCVNYMIQSSASDMMKIAMIRSGPFLRQWDLAEAKIQRVKEKIAEKLDGHQVLTIHDELIFEFKEDHLDKRILGGIRDIMTDTKEYLETPMEVDFSIVRENWSKKVKLDDNFEEVKEK